MFSFFLQFCDSQPKVKDKESWDFRSGYEKEPARPIDLPKNAKWVGSVDTYGSWFTINAVDNKDPKKFRIRCYEFGLWEKGQASWDGLFEQDSDGNFSLQQSYQISMCNYEECTISQKDKEFIFRFLKAFNYKPFVNKT